MIARKIIHIDMDAFHASVEQRGIAQLPVAKTVVKEFEGHLKR